MFQIGKGITVELTGRGHNETNIQVSRMKAALFALRSNDLLCRRAWQSDKWRLKIRSEVARREHYDVRQRMSNHRRLKPFLPVKIAPNQAES